ncbi:hypothetical protein BDR05DRAFT_743072 [Suillus weaverae]|nr:hypothetical protein BDR05DRAFT_743072 [Suillus weaverae]
MLDAFHSFTDVRCRAAAQPVPCDTTFGCVLQGSNNMNVVDWLDRPQASIRQPGTAPPTDPNFLRNLRNPSAVAVDDSEDDDPDAEEGPVEEEDVEKVRDSLPDAAVPIGLLANLSLGKDKDKGKGRGRQGGNAGAGGGNTKPEDDDDNVVSDGSSVLE